jgi:16S rRNA (adenine1518-N6/adenine1519-N6)-dimethyltransferase
MIKITFVDAKDNVIGVGSKEDAWSKGIIARISRIYVFNSQGEFLLQKRSDNHPSAPGKWDQSAAGHVDEGESYFEAALREAKEELGIEGLELQELKKYYTDEKDEADKIKKRFNMLYKTVYDGEINFGEDEVSETKWIQLSELEVWMKESPQDFTEGFMQSYQVYKSLN